MTPNDDGSIPGVDSQIRALIEIIGTCAGEVSRLTARVDRLTAEVQSNRAAGGTDTAAWVWCCPEGDAEDEPSTMVEHFVSFYNASYVGPAGGRARSIPPCWREHPGLAAEVAVLACGWRTANQGASASIRDAEQWLHQWRPGFADRMVRDWAHADCWDGDHRPTNA